MTLMKRLVAVVGKVTQIDVLIVWWWNVSVISLREYLLIEFEKSMPYVDKELYKTMKCTF